MPRAKNWLQIRFASTLAKEELPGDTSQSVNAARRSPGVSASTAPVGSHGFMVLPVRGCFVSPLSVV